MRKLHELIAAAAVVTGLVGCGASTEAVRPRGIQYAQQGVLSVPAYDWTHAHHDPIDLNATPGGTPDGVRVQGRLDSDGRAYHEGAGTRYDIVRDTVDVNGDGRIDMVRVTFDTQITTAPDPRLIGFPFQGRALGVCSRLDGQVDGVYVDNVGREDRRGYDGRYDSYRAISGTTIDEAVQLPVPAWAQIIF